jgi:large subunit ribosomal protein L19e
MAAAILKCGENRVWMDPDRLEEISKAVTRKDIKILIKGGVVKSKQIQGISGGRRRYIQQQKQKGRRKGHGSRKGAKYARLSRKERWIKTIRPIRAYLRQLRDDKSIDRSVYRRYYRKAKGGEFKSRHHLKTHLISDGVLKEDKQ